MACFFLSGCNNSPYPDYSRLNSGLYMNLIEIGDKNENITTGDYITADISYRKMNDSLFFKARRRFTPGESPYKGSLNEGLFHLSEEDSAGFILKTKNFFHNTLNINPPGFMEEEEYMKINIRVLDVQSSEEYEEEKQLFLSWAREFRLSELDIISKYLKDNKIEIEPEPNGIYFLSHEEGNGPKVEKGKHIWIHYEGKFLNGKFVDSSKKRNTPLDFIYGNEMYLIEGLNYAVGEMREGGTAMILIPSELGFGSLGSVKGVVPPYTAMIYLVEVLTVD